MQPAITLIYENQLANFLVTYLQGAPITALSHIKSRQNALQSVASFLSLKTIVTSMPFNILSSLVIFFVAVFASEIEETQPFEGTFVDSSSFECEKLDAYDQIPLDLNWRHIVHSSTTEECFRRLANNWQVQTTSEHGKQLFEIARSLPDIVTEKLFCVLARRISYHALVEDLSILEKCGVDRNRYPTPLIALLFKRAEYRLADVRVDPKRINWGDLCNSSDIDRELKQRLWLALVAVLHDSLDNASEDQLLQFFYCIVELHGIDLDPSAPLTELDTQIIRLLPVAIEYILSRKVVIDTMHWVGNVTDLYKSLHKKVASNPRLSDYFHARFFVNPAVDIDIRSGLLRLKLQLPPINDIQMTKEIFAYGNNLSRISDPVENRLATSARQQLEGLLFPPPQE